jgi:hypothetical protein
VPPGNASADITRDGRSIADALFRGAVVSPVDLAIASDGYIYVALYGGGILVGVPQ